MSAQELTVSWPLYFAYREREAERRNAQNSAQATLG